ncbi:MAG: glycosyltransferase family 2 protein, partial [Candidatus Rokubacteria bacterium]|nr:glycosyltransferase family 2 protein [Candidatus Rokubacteria bacterium]
MISLAMIARDEAARLPACLRSAAAAVDEIVVVDTGSRDATADIARAHGARVVGWAWRDDFAAARNEALAHATGDWVLVLDADERLAPGAGARMRRLVDDGGADGYDCRLVSALPPSEPSAAISHWYCRLFRRRPGVRYTGRVHEQIAPSIRALGGRIVRGDVTILHEGYAHVTPEKVARNLALLDLELAERPDDPFVLFNRGLTLIGADRWTEAAASLERALDSGAAPLISPDLQAVAWMKLAECRLHESAWAAAGAAAERALGIQPDLALARYTLGRALFESGAFRAAGLLFDDLADGSPDALGMTLHAPLVAVARALARLRRREPAEAAAILEPVAADDASGQAALHLGNAYLALGRLRDAAAAYRTARAHGAIDPNLERRLALCDRLGPLAE